MLRYLMTHLFRIEEKIDKLLNEKRNCSIEKTINVKCFIMDRLKVILLKDIFQFF